MSYTLDMDNSYFNWSSGKDSALALYYAMQNNDIDVRYLFSIVSGNSKRLGMHEISIDLLTEQARSIGIPLRLLECDFVKDSFSHCIAQEMDFFNSQSIDTAIFGDIYLQDLREHRERKCSESGFKCAFPLWGKRSEEIIHDFIDLGFKAFVVSIDCNKLPKSFLGRTIDHDFISQYPKDADICGENGEYHTFVYDGPIFRFPVNFVVSSQYDENFPEGSYFHLILEKAKPDNEKYKKPTISSKNLEV